MDAFISWTGVDRDVKNVIADRLEAVGISCWDSDEDCTSDYSPECIAAIRQCSLFIVIISDASMQKGYVLNEVIAARNQESQGKLNMLVYKITDAPYTDAFEFQLNHISVVTENLICRRERTAGETGIDLLVRRAQRLLEQRKEDVPEKPFDVHTPVPVGLLISHAGYFVQHSRDAVLEAMEAGFQKSNVLILKEFFGFGKRSTIKKYYELHRQSISEAFLLTNAQGSLRQFLLAGLGFTNINPKRFEGLEGDALVDAKLRLLEKLSERTLLVIPDVTFEDYPDEMLCQRLLGLKCRVILLTQESPDRYEDWFPVIRVGRMLDDHLSELFFHHYVRAHEEEKDLLEEPLKRFFDNIGGHTKTVELTASVLNRDLGVAPDKLPEYLSMQGAGGLQLKDRILQQISHIFDIEQLSREESIAMLVAACLAVPYLSERHYRTVLEQCDVTDWGIVQELDRRRWLDLDLHNQTVSIEPLVAQIVLKKFSGEYPALCQCVRYLQELLLKVNSIAIHLPTLTGYLVRLEHFFRLTGLSVLSRLCGVMQHCVLGDKSSDRDSLNQALAQFDSMFPAEEFSVDPDMLTQLPCGPERFVYESQYFVRLNLLPLARLHSMGHQNLLIDFTAGGSRIAAGQLGDGQNAALDMSHLFGFERDELYTWLNELRRQVDDDPFTDDDDMESFFAMEAVAAIEAFYRRDTAAMLISVENLADKMLENPEFLENESTADLFYVAISAMCNVYLGAGSHSAIISLCEKILALPSHSRQRLRILQFYIAALRKSGQYTQELFDTYQEYLTKFDQQAADLFDKREEMLPEKKQWLLFYTDDLACAGLPDQAQTQFTAAQRLDACLLPDLTVTTANTLLDAWIHTGQFRQVPEFLRRFFPRERLEQLRSLVAPENLPILDTFSDFQDTRLTENDFDSNGDPLAYVSYYHDYSRKNNGLMERKYLSIAQRASDMDFSDFTNEQITAHAQHLKEQAKRMPMQQLAPEAFALASEAGYRVLGYRHHYVQFMGAAAMADGKIAEILNGEGKTYTIVLTAFLQSLYGQQVYVVDQSAYLSRRNENWMQGVYSLLGMRSRYLPHYLLVAGSTEDVLYLTLNDLAIAYLNSEIDLSATKPLRTDCVIIDEADTVLVDCAQETHAIVSTHSCEEVLTWHAIAWEIAQQVAYDPLYCSCYNRQVTLNQPVYELLEERYGIRWSDVSRLSTTQRIEHILRCAIICCCDYEKDKDYFIHKGQPVLEHASTGEFRDMNDSFRYFLCQLNGLDDTVVRENLSKTSKTIDLICVRDLLRKFRHLCGTTATAVSFRKEFRDIYDLDYVAVPPHLPCKRRDLQSPLYVTMQAKDQAIVQMVMEKHEAGQPVLLITQSIGESEKYDRLLRRAGIPHRLLNARNAEDSSNMIAQAGVPGSVLVASALVSRGADIKLGGSPELMTRRELVEMGTDISQLDSFLYRLPTAQLEALPLFQKYHSILEKNRLLTAADRQAAEEAGGLCVIGTSFFPEPRNEQQTRGRSGRQGAVGESIIFRSMDDDSLQVLLNPSYLDWVRSTFPDVEDVDARILRKTLQSGQQRIHDARFSAIRQAQDRTRHIDLARADFVTPRFALLGGTLTVDELLEQWLSHKRVLDRLQKLQKGEAIKDCNVLRSFYGKDSRLQGIRGPRAARCLTEVFRRELATRFPGHDYNQLSNLRKKLCQILLDAWGEYIAIVEDTVGKVSMKEQALEEFLAAEKDRLLLQVLDRMCRLKIRTSVD